ncbi:hypothetical protein Syun_019257 [Stephania yunnanensis]|uniref:H(+)-exporting diphosphatase n=1 Tax=Stephania yunnanensis TaxID=152371 RepID=A0AAP0IUH5_9MAGN
MANEGEVLAVEGEGVKCGGGGDERDEVLIRAYPKTGRKHLIRLHFQYLGIPIRGDVKYEGVHEWGGRTFDGHSLHAETLVFTHPITGVEVEDVDDDACGIGACKSVMIPIFVIAIYIWLPIAIDAYGPISDNAGGTLEMAGMSHKIRERC